jgi:hypothetical protein
MYNIKMAMLVFRSVIIHLHGCFFSHIVCCEKNTELCTYVTQQLIMFILLFCEWLINWCEVLMMACVLELYLMWWQGHTDSVIAESVSLYHVHMQSSKTTFMYIKVLKLYLKITCSLRRIHYSRALILLVFIAYTYIPQIFQNFCFHFLSKPKLCNRFLYRNSLRVGFELWKRSLTHTYHYRRQDDGVTGGTEGDFLLPGDTC